MTFAFLGLCLGLYRVVALQYAISWAVEEALVQETEPADRILRIKSIISDKASTLWLGRVNPEICPQSNPSCSSDSLGTIGEFFTVESDVEMVTTYFSGNRVRRNMIFQNE